MSMPARHVAVLCITLPLLPLLCADTSGRPLQCSSLQDLVPGQGLAYRLMSTNAACCFEGVAEDRK